MFKKNFKFLSRIFFLLIYGKISKNETKSKENIKITKIKSLKPNSSKIKNYYLYEIKDGRIYSDNVENVAVISNNKIIKDISFQQVDSVIRPAKYNCVIKEGTPRFIKKFKGTVLLLNQGAISNKNYCHWLLDVLPKIKICLQKYNLKKINYFYIQNKLTFQKQSLAKLGILDKKIIDCNKYKHIQADKIIAITHHVYKNNDYILNAQKNQPQWSINWLRQKFLKNKNNKKNKNRIFIDRSDSKNNHCRIINNDETLLLLKKLNFKIYQLSKINFIEQVKIFNNANIVVGVHGAGLTNIIFCKKKTKILEIRQKPNPNKIFQKIGLFNKLKFKVIKVNEINNNDNGDILINIQNLEKHIKNFF